MFAQVMRDQRVQRLILANQSLYDAPTTEAFPFDAFLSVWASPTRPHLFSESASLLAASTVSCFQGKIRRDTSFYEPSVTSDNFSDRTDHHGAPLMQQDAAVAPLLDQLQ